MGVIMGLYRGSNFQLLPGVWVEDEPQVLDSSPLASLGFGTVSPIFFRALEVFCESRP